MNRVDLDENELFTLQAAAEHLRAVPPDAADFEGRARRADAAFRIAYRLERVVKRAYAPADRRQSLIREAIESRARYLEEAIHRFRECGVELARFSIVEVAGVTHLCVDGISRFSWRVAWPDGRGETV